jgi:tRNA U38,U39,U40 pseudouridine synthase TruA
MDMELISVACKKLIGLHDYRNFCKKDENFHLEDDMDGENFMRRIYDIRIEHVQTNSTNHALTSYMCVIKGSAFLWH